MLDKILRHMALPRLPASTSRGGMVTYQDGGTPDLRCTRAAGRLWAGRLTGLTAIIAEPRPPETNDVGNRLWRIDEDARGIDHGPAVCALLDPLLNVLVEPVEADGHGRASHLVQHQIVHTGPRKAGNIDLLAVPIPPVGGKTDMADAGFAHGSQLKLQRIEGNECEGLQKRLPVGRIVEVLVGKADVIVVLPEYGRHDRTLRRVAEVGRHPLVVVVPAIEAVHGSGGDPIVKEPPAQLIPRFRFLEDPFRLFHHEVEPPLAHQRSPMNAMRAFCCRLYRLVPVRNRNRVGGSLIGGWGWLSLSGHAHRPQTDNDRGQFSHTDRPLGTVSGLLGSPESRSTGNRAPRQLCSVLEARPGKEQQFPSEPTSEWATDWRKKRGGPTRQVLSRPFVAQPLSENLLSSTPREEQASRRGEAVLICSRPRREVGKTGQHVIDLQRPETHMFAECPI